MKVSGDMGETGSSDLTEKVRQLAEKLVHFSFRTVNSKVSGGIRLDEQRSAIKNCPYLSVRTLFGKSPSREVFTDYFNGAQSAKIMAEVLKAKTGVHENSGAAKKILATLSDPLFHGHAEFEIEPINPRMRQVFLPESMGSTEKYRVVSPVGSAGLGKLLQEELKKHNDLVSSGESEGIKIRRALMPFGGSNPQNAGGLIRDLQVMMFFKAPTENIELREAMAIHSKGAKPRVPFSILFEWATWFEKQKKLLHGETQTTSEIREIEMGFSTKFVQNILEQGRLIKELLVEYQSFFMESDDRYLLLADSVNNPIRGWIIEADRNSDWVNDFSAILNQMVIDFSYKGVQFNLDKFPSFEENPSMKILIIKSLNKLLENGV